MSSKTLLVLTLLAATQAHAEQLTPVDIFPEREVLPDRTQIKIVIDNESFFDLYCDYINSYVTYRSKTTENNLDNLLQVKRIGIPAYQKRTVFVGSDKTDAMRRLYPDAYIDLVKGDFLSQHTRCYYRPLTSEERAEAEVPLITYIWEPFTESVAGICYEYTNGEMTNIATSTQCGKDRNILEVKAEYCTRHSEYGFPIETLKRGERDCPAK